MDINNLDLSLRKNRFAEPSVEYRSIALWRINGEPTPGNIVRQIKDLSTNGFGQIPARNIGVELRELMITTARDVGMLVMGRDGTGFPSGGASGQVARLYPQHLAKALQKTEYAVSGFRYWRCFVPCGELMAAVALNSEDNERVDLSPFIDGNSLLSWDVPTTGDWRVMFFTSVPATFWKRDMPVDYLDPVALARFREIEYDQFAKECAQYFHDPIVSTQYDDVGFLAREKTWTGSFNAKFEELFGFDPTRYYPALWYDIGSETRPARVAFFDTRSELLAEGFPRMVKEWTAEQGLISVGQPPGNYKDQPVDILGDSFKFFRHTDIPQTDAIISYGNGLHGFKLTSSASDLYDRPISMAECYGAFPEETVDVRMLYRVPTEMFARGHNSVMVHYGAWNHPDPQNMPYRIMGYPDDVAGEFPALNDFMARCCYVLTGGRTVADIALLYPIASLQAEFYFDAPEYVGRLRRGWWTYPEADYLRISGMLTNEIRRDFTFVHPEYLATDQYSVNGNKLRLETSNYQEYDILIVPGGRVISVSALDRIRHFYRSGGKVIATSLLPTQSAEIGKNEQIKAMIDEIFGPDAAHSPKLQTSQNGGMALFIPDPDLERLSEAIGAMIPLPDVVFSNVPQIEGLGYFSYIHKVREGKDVYFFGNSSDHAIETEVLLRGELELESWNPHDGTVAKLEDVSHERRHDQTCTKCQLKLAPLRSLFWIGA